MSGTLYVVGTPIGNLGDISPRAVETLENCDFIAAEDTRVSLKLLNHFGIKKPIISYFDHNKFERMSMFKKLDDLLDSFLTYPVPWNDCIVCHKGEVVYRRFAGFTDAKKTMPVTGKEKCQTANKG